MKLISWNVNGARACHKKGLIDFVNTTKPDAFLIQETKAHIDQVPPDVANINGYKAYWSSALRKGYSGVASFLKTSPKTISYGIDIPEFDQEGRFVIAEFPDFALYNVYFPNGGSGELRHNFKQDFLKRFLVHLKKRLKNGDRLIVCGDYNVAHKEFDVHDPVRLSDQSGFLPEERQWFTSFLEAGFVDTFRHFHPDAKDSYSWWSYRQMARSRNKGWRIDYFCVSENLRSKLRGAEIMNSVEGSDHCPVLLELSL